MSSSNALLRAHHVRRGANMEASAGPADIVPSRYERIERDGYLAIDAHWVAPALLRSAPIEGRVGAGRRPVPGRRLADSQARVEPARRRLAGRSLAPRTDPGGRHQ